MKMMMMEQEEGRQQQQQWRRHPGAWMHPAGAMRAMSSKVVAVVVAAQVGLEGLTY